jgi:hypothetical protein
MWFMRWLWAEHHIKFNGFVSFNLVFKQRRTTFVDYNLENRNRGTVQPY